MFKRHEEPCTPTTKNPYDFKKPYGPCPPIRQPVQGRHQPTANIVSAKRLFDPADPHVTAWDIQNQQQPTSAVSGPGVSTKIPSDLIKLHTACPTPTKVQVQEQRTVSPVMDTPCGQDVQYFGAMQFNEDLTDWGAWYMVENDGEVSNMPGWNQPGGRESLWAAGRQGLAAGKLWIDGTQAVNPDGHAFVCSGFCLGRRWFFTSKHFLQSPDWPTDAIAHNEAMDMMKDPEHARVFISIGRKSTTMLRDSDPKLRDAYLVTATDDLDIAIFQLKDHEPDWDHSVRLDQLAPARLDSPQAIFSIGYSGDCSTVEQQEQYKKYLDAIPENLKKMGDKLAMQKFEELRQKGEPTHGQLFCPSERAIAIGHTDTTVPTQSHLHLFHTVPGWFGLSGSMIARFDGGMNIHIIGTFRGGEHNQLHNQMVPFTEDMVAAIAEYMARLESLWIDATKATSVDESNETVD